MIAAMLGILSAYDAVIKVEVRDHGDGFSRALDGIDVPLESSDPVKILRVESTPGDECGRCVNSFSPAAGCRCGSHRESQTLIYK